MRPISSTCFQFNDDLGKYKIIFFAQTGITDDVVEKVLDNATRCLSDLEEFHCEHSPHLTARTVQRLIDSCPSLRRLGDLSRWTALESSFVGGLNQVLLST